MINSKKRHLSDYGRSLTQGKEDGRTEVWMERVWKCCTRKDSTKPMEHPELESPMRGVLCFTEIDLS